MKTGPKKCFHLRVYRKRTRVFEDAEPLHVKKTVHDVDLDVFLGLRAHQRRAADAVMAPRPVGPRGGRFTYVGVEDHGGATVSDTDHAPSNTTLASIRSIS